MHIVINKSKNKNSKKIYNSILLRESYRENGKVKKRTIANLSHCHPDEIEAISLALKHKKDLSVLGSIKDSLILEQGVSVGAVWTVYQMARQLKITRALGNSFQAKLALWQIITRVIEQGSRLSSVRSSHTHALSEILNISEDFNENALYCNLDWLSANQARVEDKLFHDRQAEIFLYDVTSSYLEGIKNHFGEFGYNRDGKKGKQQIVIGLLCDKEGNPISVEVFPGNTNDTKTFASQIRKAADRFGCKHVTFVGDRGMIKIPQINQLPTHFHYITAITNSQIRTLSKQGVVQLEFFEENITEIEFENIRYILRRNPIRAADIRKNRASKLEAIKMLVEQKNQYLQEHKKAKVEVSESKVQAKIEKLRLKKWLSIESSNRKLSLVIDREALREVSCYDGCYMLKTDIPKQRVSKEVIHARYKDLAKVETAFRNFKQDFLEVRPVYVRQESRTRGHVFIVMLSYLIVKKLRERWINFDLTVEEGLRHLATISSVKATIKGNGSFMRVTAPDELSMQLLEALNVDIPPVLPSKRANVVTKKKLTDRRK